MVIIRFPNGNEWFRANWIFRQLAEDVVEMFPDDDELKYSMVESAALGALFLDGMEQSVASRIVRAIRTVAERTIEGSIQGWNRTRPMDKEGQRMYMEGMSELLDILSRTDDEDSVSRP